MIAHDIRYTVLEDEPYLLSWLQDKNNLQWFPISDGDEVKEAAKNWIAYSKFKCSLTTTVDNQPAAIGTLFLMPYRKVAHHCMFYLLVDSKLQKKGLGRSMLKNLLNLARNYFRLESVYAEIFNDCPITKLLEENKFEFIIQQNHFLKDNTTYKSRIILEHFF